MNIRNSFDELNESMIDETESVAQSADQLCKPRRVHGCFCSEESVMTSRGHEGLHEGPPTVSGNARNALEGPVDQECCESQCLRCSKSCIHGE